MARAPVGVRRRAGERGRDAAAAGGGAAVRKGPWNEEEDAVLREHVRTHGPRDWSSIRSKGLLPRTGKSCRLRWVNKLRPNLKSGCKFSAEEERVVLDLQAQFGNKWARIATYLEGRTDNDVKNFWSTRQKKISRLRRNPVPGRSGKNRKGKAAVSSSPETQLTPGPLLLDQVPFEGSSSSGHAATSSMDAQNAAVVPYDQTSSELLGVGDSRLLCLPPPGWSGKNRRAKAAVASSLKPRLTQGSFLDQVPFDGSSSSGQCRAATSSMDAQNAALVPYDQTSSQLLGFEDASLLSMPPPGWFGESSSVKAAGASSLETRLTLGSFLDQVPFDGSSSSGQCRAATSFMDAQNAALAPFDQTGSQLLGFVGALLPAVPATDSQARSSNARPLPDMTDNNVKNFGCSGQKRPAGRLVRTNRSVKTKATFSLQSQPAAGPFLDLVPFQGSSSSSQDRAGTPFMDAQNSAPLPYDQTGSQLFGFAGAQPPVALATDSQASSSNAAPLFPPQAPFCKHRDFPDTLYTGDTPPPWFVNTGAMDDIVNQELLPFLQSAPPMMFPFFGMHDRVKIEGLYGPDYFGDLPPDIFGSDDELPPASSPSRTISDL